MPRLLQFLHGPRRTADEDATVTLTFTITREASDPPAEIATAGAEAAALEWRLRRGLRSRAPLEVTPDTDGGDPIDRRDPGLDP